MKSIYSFTMASFIALACPVEASDAGDADSHTPATHHSVSAAEREELTELRALIGGSQSGTTAPEQLRLLMDMLKGRMPAGVPTATTASLTGMVPFVAGLIDSLQAHTAEQAHTISALRDASASSAAKARELEEAKRVLELVLGEATRSLRGALP